MATLSNTKSDPLEVYMKDVRRFELLTREEENALAIKWRDDEDVEAAHQLVTRNLRFVVKVALEYKNYGLKTLDLIQEGNVGLMHAVRKFDPDRGYRLITYAVWWIRAYIQSYLVKGFSLVKLGTTQAQRKLFFKLRSAEAELRQLQGANHTDFSGEEKTQELARMLGVKPKEVTSMQMRMSGRDFSLDAALDSESQSRHLDLLVDEGDDSEAMVASREIADGVRRELDAGMKSLNDREREVISLRYLKDDKTTLREIGEMWGVSRERARQIESAAREKLKRHLEVNGEISRTALMA